MRRTAAVIRKVIDRWERGPHLRQDRHTENGDTLVEVLLTIVILGLTAVALLLGFATSITSSAEHRNLTSLDAAARVAVDAAINGVQSHVNQAFPCTPNGPPGFNATTLTLPNGFTVQNPQVLYWNLTQSQFGACDTTDTNGTYLPQQYTMTIASPNGNYDTTASTIVYDPALTPAQAGTIGTPFALVWLASPSTATAGQQFNTQPEIAVEDNGGNIVTSDFSSLSVQITTSQGSGTLSSTCTGVESYGVFNFNDCSISASGTYQLTATDSDGLSAVQTVTPSGAQNSIAVGVAPAAKLVFTTTASPAQTAAQTPFPNVMTVQEEDADNNVTNQALTINLSSSSTGGFFATTPTGTTSPTLTLNILAGSSTASFYYGDTVAGSPTVTAASGGLASATQVEPVKAGPPSKIGFSTPPFTVGGSNVTTTSFTVAVEDQFGNATTLGTKSTTVALSSSSGTGKFATTQGSNGSTTLNVTIAAGNSSASAFYGDPTVGNPIITANATGQVTSTATQTETITVAPVKLAFTTVAITAGATSSATIGQMTVQEQASNGTATTVPETVTLTSSSNRGVFSLTPGGATVTSVSIPAGQSFASFYYGDTKTGTPTITASAVGLSAATQVETITPGAVSIFVLSAPGTQTCGAPFSETITAEDGYGNTVTTYGGAQVLTFTGPSSSPNGTAPAYPTPVTFNNGVATGVSITLYDAQTTHLTATAGLVTGSTANFAVNGGTTNRLAMATPGTQTAGIGFTESITATDTWGNTATTYTGTKTVNLSGPTASPNGTAPKYPAGNALTFNNGVGLAPITLYNAQTTTLTGTQGALTGQSGSFTVAGGAPAKFSLPNPGTQAAGTSFSVTVNATDAYGNVATSYAGNQTLSFSGPANSPNGTAPSYPTPVTFTAGTANAPVTLYDAQTTSLTVTQGTATGNSGAFNVTAASGSQFNLSTPSSPTAGVPFTETITVGDQYGNGGANVNGPQTVSWSGPSSSPNGTAPSYGSSTINFANGTGSTTVTLYDAQSTALTATSTTFSGASATFTVATGALSIFTLPTPGNQTAGMGFSQTVNGTDAWGNGYTGAEPVTWTGASNSPNGTQPSLPTSLNFTGGAATASVTLFDAQSLQLTASAAGVSAGTTPSFTVSSGSTTALAVTNPGTQTAGAAFNVNLTASDTWGNPTTTLNGAQSVAFTGPGTSPNGTAPSYPASVNFTNGAGTANGITLYDAQNATLNAATGGASGSTSFTVSPAAVAGITVPTPGTQAAGNAFNVTINAADAYGNTSTNLNGPQSVSFSGPLSSPGGTAPTYPTSVTFTGGAATASVTLYDAQSTTLGVTTSGGTATTNSFTVTSGALQSISLPSTVLTQDAGTSFNLKVTGTDGYGNPYGTGFPSGSAVPIVWAGASASPNNTNPSYPTNVTFTNGSGTAALTLYDAQAVQLTASFTGSSAGQSNFFNVLGGSTPASFSFNPIAAQNAGQSFNVTVTATDLYGNPATSLTGGVALTFSGPAKSPSGTAPLYPAGPFLFQNGASTAIPITLYDAGTGVTLTATSGSATGTSAGFTVNGGTAVSLSIANPGTQTAGSPFNVTLTSTDSYGNPSSLSGSQTIAFSGPSASPNATAPSYPTSATNVTFTNGAGTVSGITLYNAQSTTLTAMVGTLSGSTTFTVNAAAYGLFFTAQPTGPVGVNTNFLTQPTLTAKDTYGNIDSGFTSSVTLSIATYAASGGGHNQGTLHCTNNGANATGGVLTFAGCQIQGTTGPAGTYALKATGGGLNTVANSNNVTITAGTTATQLVYTTPPVGGVGVNTNWSTQPTVTAEDATGDTVSGFTSAITLSIGTYTNGNGGFAKGGIKCTNNGANAVGGVLTFTGCQITGTNNNAGNYTIKATGGGFTMTSGNVNIT